MKKILKINFLVFVLLYSFSLNAQDNQKPIEVTIGTIKTDLKQNAINFGLSYLKSLDSLWEKQDFLLDGNKSLFLITPDISIKSGNGDAFSSISAKLTGLTMLFDTISVAGQVTPNTAKTFHTFPLSLGIETNNKFNVVNGIAELGWVPWYQAASRNTPDFLKRTKFGIFIQGGYKFAVDTTGKQAVGGEIDQSKEKTDNAIFRAKGSFGIDTKSLFHFSGVGVGLVGSTDGWYDFLNSEIYYTIQGKLRLYLTESEDKFFDFQYQKGSGAPNFNQGDQYGIGLTVTF
jgi:hypothetical protein